MNKLQTIRQIIIHCSATPDDDASTIDVDAIRSWHVSDNRWDDIGYHLVIPREGQKQYGRSMAFQGAHARGHNDDSIGICLVGTRRFNDVQLSTLVKVVRGLCLMHDIKAYNVRGHRELLGVTKECPGFDVCLIRASLSCPS